MILLYNWTLDSVWPKTWHRSALWPGCYLPVYIKYTVNNVCLTVLLSCVCVCVFRRGTEQYWIYRQLQLLSHQWPETGSDSVCTCVWWEWTCKSISGPTEKKNSGVCNGLAGNCIYVLSYVVCVCVCARTHLCILVWNPLLAWGALPFRPECAQNNALWVKAEIILWLKWGWNYAYT